MNHKIWRVALALALGGCANGFDQYYSANPNVSADQIAERRILPAPTDPEVVHGIDPKTDSEALSAEGYMAIGQSIFNGPATNDAGAIAKGKALGADKILIYANYTGTVNTFIPIKTPTTQYSTTSISGNAFGPSGISSISGTGTTTTYGTQTTNIPVSINRFQHLAVFLVKMKFAFGAISKNLTSDQAKAAGSVNGAAVVSVVIGSPAASAGILPGDVVTQADNVKILDAKQFFEYLNSRQGKSVKIYLVRNGVSSTKIVKLDTI